MVRSLLSIALTSLVPAWAAMVGCDATDAPAVDTMADVIDHATGALADASTASDSAADTTADIEIMYPGYQCTANSDCSTGLCYGSATKQGVFEPASCQTVCLPPMDFANYCDSNDDCCRGRCCLNCGAREGLCILGP
jgi:hypothetical protein